MSTRVQFDFREPVSDVTYQFAGLNGLLGSAVPLSAPIFDHWYADDATETDGARAVKWKATRVEDGSTIEQIVEIEPPVNSTTGTPSDSSLETTLLSDFYLPLRLLLGDNDPQAVYQYQDAALDGAVRCVFAFGNGPESYALNGDRNSCTGITPGLPNGDAFAKVVYEAGMILIGGDVGANSYRTRALSVSVSGDRVKNLLADLRVRLYRIDGGDGFATYQSLITWLASFDGGVGVNVTGANANLTIQSPALNFVN
jgi:hypothetical protein